MRAHAMPLSDGAYAAHLKASVHGAHFPNADLTVIQLDNQHMDEGGLLRAPRQVAATILCVASLAATVTMVRHLNDDAAASSLLPVGAAGASAPPPAVLPSLVSIAPLDGRLVIVFPRPSARSSIRVERHDGSLAMFGGPSIDQAPLVVLPGELRVQELPAAGAAFELRVPAGVTDVHVRIAGATLARWSAMSEAREYGRRIPLRRPEAP